ncbi:sigma-54 interaction domain-containing protein [Magnetofaba australis]|uniref:Putative sigma-54 dependent transcription regulator n=1 Tax=Magnetofaba australis IT-1 TaxID=1434232 RepID=A0A1Y2K0I7_9PROT|nr:sigma-54 dependent transcriptional regulator [Magnetofaba australis]OSM01541.1 putative sigma-54 dependent transcription regulator [Magnetofaba australis IT-1]
MYGIIGSAPSMQQLFKLIERVAIKDSTVLIQGESGTGKELICKAIHQASPRKDQPLIAVNCGAIPEDLLESELFGHVRGAFTGAANTRPGRFELANNGTIFLDEIGDMSPKLQVKMLRVLQEKVIEPVGAVQSKKVNVRVVAATHKDLEKMVADGDFREDLFYRLNVVPLHVPPLRERLDDLPALIDHFLAKCAKNQGHEINLAFGKEIYEAFNRYEWKGNIRELENLVERLTILADDEVELTDLPQKIVGGQARPASSDDRIPASAFKIQYESDGSTDFNREVESYENRLILDALNRTGWNKNKAARLLNLNRTTLVEKIKKKGLEREEGAQENA